MWCKPQHLNYVIHYSSSEFINLNIPLGICIKFWHLFQSLFREYGSFSECQNHIFVIILNTKNQANFLHFGVCTVCDVIITDVLPHLTYLCCKRKLSPVNKEHVSDLCQSRPSHYHAVCSTSRNVLNLDTASLCLYCE